MSGAPDQGIGRRLDGAGDALRCSVIIVVLAVAMSIAASARARDPIPVETLWHIQGIEVAAGAPWYLYLATHQGIFLAGDDGFAERLSANGDDFRSLARRPGAGNVFYGGVGTPAGTNRGLMVSKDGARTWSVLSRIAEPPVTFSTLAISSADPNVLYGAGPGFYVSRDGGRSWSEGVMPADRIFDLAASSMHSKVVYAATTSGLMRSEDAGSSWQSAFAPQAATTLVHVTPDGAIYTFVVGQGLLRATEPALDWTTLHRSFGRYVVRHIAVDPAAADHLFAVTDNSEVLASEDGGKTWAALHSQYIDAQP